MICLVGTLEVLTAALLGLVAWRCTQLWRQTRAYNREAEAARRRRQQERQEP